MSLLDRTADADFRPIDEWSLPKELTEFVSWLREAVDGKNDDERIARFLTYPAAAYMPTGLREALLQSKTN